MLDINRLIDEEMLTDFNFKEISNYLSFVYITEEFPCLSYGNSVENLLNNKSTHLNIKAEVNKPEMTKAFKMVIVNALLVKEFPYLNTTAIRNFVTGKESLISLDSNSNSPITFLDSSALAKEKVKHEEFFSKLFLYESTEINSLYSMLKTK